MQVLKKVLTLSLSREMIVIALFTCICLKDKLGLCSMNCHIHAMTGNCSASLRVLAISLRVIYAMTGNLLFGWRRSLQTLTSFECQPFNLKTRVNQVSFSKYVIWYGCLFCLQE